MSKNVLVTGNIKIKISLDLPDNKVELKKLAVSLNLSPDASINDIVRALVEDGTLYHGIDRMLYQHDDILDIDVSDLNVTTQ